MNTIAATFVFLNAVLLISLPRRWAAVPLIFGTFYISLGQGIELGPFYFSAIRLLIAAGILRLIIRMEKPQSRANAIDFLMVAWAVWAIISSQFHAESGATLINRLGLVYNCLGFYFLLRIFCTSPTDLRRVVAITAVLLLPIAAEMIQEKITGRNLFSIFGDLPEECFVRDGKIRAQASFRHPILAGTVGAVCFPLVLALRRSYPRICVLGSASCIAIVLASASSGPLMSLLAAVFGLVLWRYRQYMHALRWVALLTYLGLDLIMKAPAYYVLAKIDLTGSSTGYHRAALIEAAIRHIHEWWLFGTDFTRHWMPTGVSWSPDHTDITNHYIQMGVLGGLPLMITFLCTICLGFVYVGRAIRCTHDTKDAWFVWCLGTSLFANAATCISVSYFDQSVMFLYLTLASIASLYGFSSLQQRVSLDIGSNSPTTLNQGLA